MTILTPIAALLTAVELGIKLGFEPPSTLTFSPARKAPKYLVDGLRRFKPQLLALLQMGFVLVASKTVGEILFFCEDEPTKERLMWHGAEESSIYTRAELRILCEQNRVAPLSPDELIKVHEIKRTFHGRIAN